MFTGIIEHLGKVRRISKKNKQKSLLLELEVPKLLASALKKGGSLAVNGACLTVIKKIGHRVFFDVTGETVKRTNLGNFKAGQRVHLERPLKFTSRLDGHLVLGHVDGRGQVCQIKSERVEKSVQILFPARLGKFLVEKGSIAIDGVSLTIGKVTGRRFWVHLVPHTLKSTCFNEILAGQAVNLETDLLAKLASKRR